MKITALLSVLAIAATLSSCGRAYTSFEKLEFLRMQYGPDAKIRKVDMNDYIVSTATGETLFVRVGYDWGNPFKDAHSIRIEDEISTSN